MSQTLLPLFCEGATPINGVLSYERRDGWVTYFHACHPVFRHAENDLKSFRMFTASLVVNGSCRQVDIVKAFGVPPISVKRAVKKFRKGDVAAFFERRLKRKPRVLKPKVIEQAQGLLSEGVPRKDVAEKLGIKADTLYRAIRAGRLFEGKKKAKRHGPRASAV